MFILPADRSTLDATQTEQLRLDCEAEIVALKNKLSTLRLERNELKRRDISVSDSMTKLAQMIREHQHAADVLRSEFFTKR